MSIPSLIGIPVEIRLRLYAYLLLDQNNVIVDASYPKPHSIYTAATSLSLVNRALSSEVLHYFYSQNAFVAVEHNASNLRSKLSCCIPIFESGLVDMRCHSYGLRIKYVTDGGHSPYQELDEPEEEVEHLVFAGRHLPKFVRMLNYFHSTIAGLEPTVRIELEFSSLKGHFSSCHRTRNMLLDGMKGIRQLSKYLYLGHWKVGHPIILNIHGQISSDEREALLTCTNLPSPNSRESVNQIKDCQKRGDVFLRARDYGAALGEYEMTYYLASFPAWYIEMSGDTALTTEIQLLMLTIRMRLSELWSLLRQHSRAFYAAMSAWEMLPKIVYYAPNAITNAGKASIQRRIGQALYDDANYEKATRAFELAHKLYPRRKDGTEKILLAREKIGKTNQTNQ